MAFIHFIQQNLRKSSLGNVEIREIMDVSDVPVICLLQEVHQYRGRLSEIPRKCQTLMCKDAPRAAIVTSNNVNIWPLYQFFQPDLVAGLVKWGLEEVVIISVYCDIHKDPVPSGLLDLLEKYSNKQIIIGCDSNSHSCLWGSPEGNRRGEDWESLILNENLIIHNTGKSTFSRKNTETHIDITLTRNFSNPQTWIENWRVTHGAVSDHGRIEFELRKKDANIDQPPEYIIYTDWRGLNGEIENNIFFEEPDFWTCDTLDDATNHLNEIVSEALQNNSNFKKKSSRTPVLPYWDVELDSLKTSLNRAWHRYSKNETD